MKMECVLTGEGYTGIAENNFMLTMLLRWSCFVPANKVTLSTYACDTKHEWFPGIPLSLVLMRIAFILRIYETSCKR